MHGMCTLAMSVRGTLNSIDKAWEDLERVGCRFTSVVLPGDSLRVQGRRVDDAVYTFETFNGEGKRAITEGMLSVR